jgi:hypothetical protein
MDMNDRIHPEGELQQKNDRYRYISHKLVGIRSVGMQVRLKQVKKAPAMTLTSVGMAVWYASSNDGLHQTNAWVLPLQGLHSQVTGSLGDATFTGIYDCSEQAVFWWCTKAR